MSKSSVHISKLTEAAWIQDVRRQVDRRDKIIELFREYRETCDAIVILRGFVRDGGVLYELIEIPTDLFGPIDYLDTATAQLATIPVPPNSDHPYIKIRIDRSDSKITVTQILLAVCAVHARWVLTAREMRNS